MLFQSYGFIFGFLPMVVLCCQWLRRPGIDTCWRSYSLVVASLIFYGVLSPTSLPFLLISCTMNLLIGSFIHRARSTSLLKPATLAGTGVALNVVVLIALKYSGELRWMGTSSGYFPLGASFITFVQIVYLLETLNGGLRKLSPAEYLQVSTFFGYVTSGPVVSASELVTQQDATENDQRLDMEHLLAGVALFAIGLFKKLVVADSLAPYAAVIFDAAQQGHAISTGDAWLGSTLYMLQLYFDFSGYCDMAIAVGYLVGMRLPLNFNSPFKATTVMDYWRRWHMTLTRFITHYLYLPLAVKMARWVGDWGIEAELARFALTVAMPTVVAFIVAGVWHGNGWTYFAYGLYWGIALSVCQAWGRFSRWRVPAGLAWVLTMSTALASLVIFRSPSLEAAAVVLRAAGGMQSAGTALLPPVLGLLVLVLVGALVLLPNSQQIVGRYRISSDEVEEPPRRLLACLTWSPSPAGAVLLGLTLVAALLMGGGPTQFLYYKF